MGDQPPSVFNKLADVYNNEVAAKERFLKLCNSSIIIIAFPEVNCIYYFLSEQ